jgi:ATP adenylyltransferase
VIPNHFILATKLNKPQTSLLEKQDLAATYACLKAWEESSIPSSENGSKSRLFAFFNSGEQSGASQPHRHLQFLPVEDMISQDGSSEWAPLIDRPISGSQHAPQDVGSLVPLDDLPFVSFAVGLQSPSADELHQTYLSLYRAAVGAVKRHSLGDSTNVNGELASPSTASEGPADISYNLAMTTSRMMICPRLSETAQIPLDESSKRGLVNEGSVSLNGTILAGTLMVKAESEWEALRCRPETLEGILETVGVPRSVNSLPSTRI